MKRTVAYNPIKRKYETVHPEDEIGEDEILHQYFSYGLRRWVTIPDLTEVTQ